MSMRRRLPCSRVEAETRAEAEVMTMRRELTGRSLGVGSGAVEEEKHTHIVTPKISGNSELFQK